MAETSENWLEPQQTPQERGEVLYVDVDGYEGPLDLLLDLARKQKVDLASISVLALAEQYLAFIDTIRQKRIEIAADYLVMAAWLAYLKSRLMVPQVASDDEPSGEDLAAALQFRLKRLEAMRAASSALMRRGRLGIDIFPRGAPEPIIMEKHMFWDVSLFELLKAYATQRERGTPNDYVPHKRTVWALREARELLERLMGSVAGEWVSLQFYLVEYLADPGDQASVLASSFSASLELVRQGHVELRQNAAFGPLLMRRKKSEDSAGPWQV